MSRLLSPPPVAPTQRSASLLFAPIVHEMEAVEQIYVETIANSRPAIGQMLAHLNHYRGKRLRPALLLLTAQACGETNRNHHILGAVVEMVHTATLVHDDVLDEANIRRHVQTVNAEWGNKASILLGDYLFTHAFHLSSMTGDARACEIIGEATNRVCEGELHQVLERGNLDLTEDEYFDIIDGKTAALTACCCRLGALYAGASDEVVERLSNYGRLLGLAFQVADDLLDLVGHEQTVGKTLGTDLDQQKLTLPIIRALVKLPANDGAVLRQCLAEGPARRRDAMALIAKTDAIEYARRRALQFAEEAAEDLICLAPTRASEILRTLTHWAVQRDT